MTGIERKLTTILAADVVGFSKMMGRDETGTLANLKDCRAIIDGGIAEHRGRVFGSAGDSVIAEFSSPVQAVLCANDFQKLLAERNDHDAAEKKMQFRVGVNMGDVIVDGDNLYGEGVNVAARDCVAGLLRGQPDLTLRNMRPAHFAEPAMAERYAQGLVEAGLPEGA